MYLWRYDLLFYHRVHQFRCTNAFSIPFYKVTVECTSLNCRLTLRYKFICTFTCFIFFFYFIASQRAHSHFLPLTVGQTLNSKKGFQHSLLTPLAAPANSLLSPHVFPLCHHIILCLTLTVSQSVPLVSPCSCSQLSSLDSPLRVSAGGGDSFKGQPHTGSPHVPAPAACCLERHCGRRGEFNLNILIIEKIIIDKPIMLRYIACDALFTHF